MEVDSLKTPWKTQHLQKSVNNINLVGGIPTPLKNVKVSWDDYSQYMEK